MDPSGHGRISFLGRRLPSRFEVRIVTVPPGGELGFHDAEWRGAIVAVEGGRIELASASGASRFFDRGDLLWLDGLPLRALRNPGREPTVLVAVSRSPPRVELHASPPPRRAGLGTAQVPNPARWPRYP
jgi:quercetin dioxygenase-like cupin family protein